MNILTLNQRDSRWANIKLGTSDKTIGSHGCTITCLASILGVTPDVVNSRLNEIGGYANTNLVNWSKLPTAFPQIKSTKRVTAYNNDEVSQNLPCLVEVDGARIGATKHWVVYMGNKEMMDPWYGTVKGTSYYPPTGYCVITPKEVDIITPEPIAQPMDVRLELLDDANIKTEGETREAIGHHKDFPSLEKTKNELQEKYDELVRIHASIKEDFVVELEEAESKYRSLREFLVRLAKATGATQNIEDVEAKIGTLIAENDKCQTKLKAIIDDRPITKHPLDGLGKALENLILAITAKINGK